MRNWELETLEKRIERGQKLELIANYLEQRLKRVNGLIEVAYQQKTAHTMDIYQDTKSALLDLKEKLEAKRSA